MLRIAEYVEQADDILTEQLVQLGVSEVVSVLPRDVGPATSGTVAAATRSDEPWDVVPLALLKQRFHDRGLGLTVIEDSPPMEAIRIGSPGRDEEIASLATLVEVMGRLRIPVLCLNFMAGSGWSRTNVALRGRGGALVTGYDHAVLDGFTSPPIRALTRDQLWENYEWFVRRIAPVAEEAGVHIAIHPDDPPISEMRGVARIMSTLDDLERAVEIASSPNVGITFCQGNIALMTGDVPSAIRRFAHLGAIHFVHFRDVRGTSENFVETFHDEGPTDMYQCIRTFLEHGVDAPMRSDHVPTLAGDSHARPGYSSLARLWAVGYMTGLHEAATTELSIRP